MHEARGSNPLEPTRQLISDCFVAIEAQGYAEMILDLPKCLLGDLSQELR